MSGALKEEWKPLAQNLIIEIHQAIRDQHYPRAHERLEDLRCIFAAGRGPGMVEHHIEHKS
jgi:hypothetical protein